MFCKLADLARRSLGVLSALWMVNPMKVADAVKGGALRRGLSGRAAPPTLQISCCLRSKDRFHASSSRRAERRAGLASPSCSAAVHDRKQRSIYGPPLLAALQHEEAGSAPYAGSPSRSLTALA